MLYFIKYKISNIKYPKVGKIREKVERGKWDVGASRLALHPPVIGMLVLCTKHLRTLTYSAAVIEAAARKYLITLLSIYEPSNRIRTATYEMPHKHTRKGEDKKSTYVYSHGRII